MNRTHVRTRYIGRAYCWQHRKIGYVYERTFFDGSSWLFIAHNKHGKVSNRLQMCLPMDFSFLEEHSGAKALNARETEAQKQ